MPPGYCSFSSLTLVKRRKNVHLNQYTTYQEDQHGDGIQPAWILPWNPETTNWTKEPRERYFRYFSHSQEDRLKLTQGLSPLQRFRSICTSRVNSQWTEAVIFDFACWLLLVPVHTVPWLFFLTASKKFGSDRTTGCGGLTLRRW